jgi:hypothetical protein
MGTEIISLRLLKVLSKTLSPVNVEGNNLPRRAHNMVLEWADLHRTELMENWKRARRGQELIDIESLE